jgi:hypothetical protein
MAMVSVAREIVREDKIRSRDQDNYEPGAAISLDHRPGLD